MPEDWVVVDVQAPADPGGSAAEHHPRPDLGRRRYDTLAEATVDGDRLVWAMTYRVHEGDRQVSEETVSFPSFVVSDDVLLEAGLEPMTDLPVGVLAWRL